MVNIFIANLDWDITSEDLRTTFSAFGEVTYAHVVFEKETKRSRGFGYVEMVEADHAINAITALNGMDVNGRKLDVKVASPKENRPPRKEVRKKMRPNTNSTNRHDKGSYVKSKPTFRNTNTQ
jgi:RNA recognition motif-containing protein